MSTINKYVIEDVSREQGDYLFDTYSEAKGAADITAASNGEPFAVIELEFEYSDSSFVYATDGSTVWPPNDD